MCSPFQLTADGLEQGLVHGNWKPEPFQYDSSNLLMEIQETGCQH